MALCPWGAYLIGKQTHGKLNNYLKSQFEPIKNLQARTQFAQMNFHAVLFIISEWKTLQSKVDLKG